jgi:hypothetical protein
MPLGGLLGPSGVPKPALTRLAALRKGIKEGRWTLPGAQGA